ncbi:unnamed protein product, partial [Didymodactylos carnosus]
TYIEKDNGETVDLYDLFMKGFRLTYKAGQLIKNIKLNNSLIFNKQYKDLFQNLPKEPVTIADLLSHAIITNGLKSTFPRVKIVSEEKPSDPISDDQMRLIKSSNRLKNMPKLPSIERDYTTMVVPLSSVTVWIDPLDATQEYTENLTDYVMVMFCVAIEGEPTIGILYAPFTEKFVWGWFGVDKSWVDLSQPKHIAQVHEVIVSRSHAGNIQKILQKIYADEQFEIVPAAGSGYKTLKIIEEQADFYLHVTAIKKWDTCAPNALLRAHNGHMTTLNNKTIDYKSDNDIVLKDGLLATLKRDHNEVLNKLNLTNIAAQQQAEMKKGKNKHKRS